MRLLWCSTCLICIELWSSRLICFVLISSRATCSTLYRFCASAQNRINAIFLCLKIGKGLFTCACAWISAICPSVHPWNHNVLCNPVRQVIYKIYKNWRMAISFSWAYYMVPNVKTCCETSTYVNNILYLITHRINTLKNWYKTIEKSTGVLCGKCEIKLNVILRQIQMKLYFFHQMPLAKCKIAYV